MIGGTGAGDAVAAGVWREQVFFGLTLAAFALALAVRLFGIDYSLWHDEIASVTFARQPAALLWSDWMIREPNPPLFYTSLHYWTQMFGTSDVAVKSLATLFGVSNVVVAALIARRLGDSWVPAFVTALFIALNPYHILFSQHGRSFTLAALTASIACLALVRIVKKHHDGSAKGGAPADWGLFGLAMVAALYSHTTMLVFYASVNLAIAIWIAINRRDRRLVGSWVLCNLFICAAYAWWAWITWNQLGSNKNLDWMDEVYLGTAVYYVLEVFAPQPAYLPSGVAAVALTPVVLFALTKRWGAAIMVLCGTALMLFFLGSQVKTIMQERTILWIYPLFAVGLGLAIARIRNSAFAAVLVAVPLTLSCVEYRDDFPRREWDRWPDIVALAGEAPSIPVFVTSEAFALAFDHYCNQRFGKCPVRNIAVSSPDDSPWSIGLSGRTVLGQDQAWSLGEPVLRTIEWTDIPTLFPGQRACSPSDRSPAYRASETLVRGELKMVTWRLRSECGGG